MKCSSPTPGAVQALEAAQPLVAAHPPQLGAVPAELARRGSRPGRRRRPRCRPRSASSRITACSAAACWRARCSSVTSRMTPTKPVGSPSQPLIARTWTSAQRSAPATVRNRCEWRSAARSPLQQRRERAGVLGAVVGVHELPRRAPEAVLDGEPGGVGPRLAQMRPAARLVGLEDAVGHALQHAAMALLAAAQAALGVAERGQVGVDDDGAEAAAVGADDRPAALEQRAPALGRLHVDLDVAHLLAAQRAQQRRLVRAERRPVGMAQAEALGPLERVQVVVDLGAVEGEQPAVGVGDADALAELREHRGQEPALLLQRALQLALGADVAEGQHGVRDLAGLAERHHVEPERRARCARRPTRACRPRRRARRSRTASSSSARSGGSASAIRRPTSSSARQPARARPSPSNITIRGFSGRPARRRARASGRRAVASGARRRERDAAAWRDSSAAASSATHSSISR